MSLYGVYYRMEDGNRRTPFRNQAQIVVSKTCVTYSTRPMAGETKRTQLPIQWHGDTEFSVDWRPVNWRWGKAATFRAHNENGERGLEEQGKHFWRFQSAAAQNVQDHQRSHQARTPQSRAAPPRPTGASTTDDFVERTKTAALPSPSQRSVSMLRNDFDATAKVAALAPTSRVPVSGSNKTCFADFDPTPYGSEYLRLTQGDVIQDVKPTMAAEGWAYGSRVLADGSLSDPGWYPHSYAQ